MFVFSCKSRRKSYEKSYYCRQPTTSIATSLSIVQVSFKLRRWDASQGVFVSTRHRHRYCEKRRSDPSVACTAWSTVSFKLIEKTSSINIWSQVRGTLWRLKTTLGVHGVIHMCQDTGWTEIRCEPYRGTVLVLEALSVWLISLIAPLTRAKYPQQLTDKSYFHLQRRIVTLPRQTD